VEKQDSPVRRDLLAVIFLVITLGLAALELWGIFRHF
jgi:hypothetical protein